MARREINLGVTAPVPKGEWNSTEKYQVLNIVTKGTASYMAISPNMGIEPETHLSWTSYWQLLSKPTEPTKETWTFTLEDGSVVTKQVHVG